MSPITYHLLNMFNAGVLACLIVICPAQAADVSRLPPAAFIVETQAVPVTAHPDRALVLWMLRPVKHDRGPYSEEDNIYTCPEMTRGSYYEGPTRISLINTKRNDVINTVEIRGSDPDVDVFDVPYRIQKNDYYRVPGELVRHEGKPSLLALRNLKGEGQALETALFNAEACMGLETELIGYSIKQDRVIQYPVTLTITEKGTKDERTQLWVDYLFGKKPVRPGYWKYEIDYRGRGGELNQYEIRYDAANEKFTGTLRRTAALL